MSNKAFNVLKAELKLQFGQMSELEDVGGVNMYETWINYAYKRLTTRDRFYAIKVNFHFPQLETIDTSITTTDGTQYVSTPSDALVVRHLYDYTNKRYIEPISWEEYVRYPDRFDTSAEGEPTEWVRAGSYLYLHPTPDTSSEAIYVYYRKVPADLSGTSTTVIGEEWDESILQLAYIIGKSWLGEYEEADRMKKEWLDNVSGLMGIYYQEELARKDSMKPSVMSSMGGYKE